MSTTSPTGSFAPSTAADPASATSWVARSRPSAMRTARSPRRQAAACRGSSCLPRWRASPVGSYRACARSCRRPMASPSGRPTRKHARSSGPRRAVSRRGCGTHSVSGPRKVDDVLMRVPVARSRIVARAIVLGGLIVLCLALLARPETPRPGASATQKIPTPPASADICAYPEQVRALITEFIDAYDQGETGLADRFFATGPAFQWYSEQPLREGSPAYERSTLEAYLRQRHADGDRLTVMSVQINSVSSGHGNFGFVLDRAGTQLPSKGALDCASHKFIVWSIGPNAGPVP